jgi:hypothetical protein
MKFSPNKLFYLLAKVHIFFEASTYLFLFNLFLCNGKQLNQIRILILFLNGLDPLHRSMKPLPQPVGKFSPPTRSSALTAPLPT